MIKFFRNLLNNFKEYFIVVALLIISLSILSINNKPGIKKIKSYSFGTFAVFNSLVSEFIDLFGNKSELEELRKLNAELMLEVNGLREHGLENEELKKLLTFKDSSSIPLVPGKVISTIVSKIQGNFILNIGESDSIKIGMPVITNKGLAGITISVSKNFSLVRTFQNSDFKLAVRNQSSGIDGILNWDGSQLIISNIPTTSDMEIGDRIISSDISTIIPPAIPIGLIIEKEKSVSGLLSNIIVKPFVKISSVRNVFVMQVIPSKQIDGLELNLLK